MKDVVTLICIGVIILAVIWGLFSGEDARQERIATREERFMREVRNLPEEDDHANS